MAYVADVIEAAILAAGAPMANGRRYIVTDDRAYSTRELYEAICRALAKLIPRWHFPLSALRVSAKLGDGIGRLRGRRAPFDSDVLAKMIGSDLYSCEKIARELGYQPSMTFEKALPAMIEWYRRSQAR
jgi:nucleoside-diphosphate-sugar epimerase